MRPYNGLMKPIVFGTDGWRDIIADNYTFANVAKVAQAYADYLLEQGSSRVVVGYDTRFESADFAKAAAEVLAANNLIVWLASRYTPTPAVSFAVLHYEAAGGVMITASHNPPRYNGLKIKGDYGGSATPEIIRGIEDKLGHSAPKTYDPTKHHLKTFDIRKPYFEHLTKQLSLEVLRGFQGHIYHDAMGGAGSGWLAAFVKYAQLPLELRQLHGLANPMFYGVNPEPIPQNLENTSAILTSEEDPVFAVVTDGDADRIAAVLAGGRYFNSHQIFAVLMKHLVGRGFSGRVVRTFSVSKVIELLADHLGLELVTTPIGFKYITDEFLKGGVMMGGEESGGIGIAAHLPERDGLLNAMMLLEASVQAQKSLGELFADIESEIRFKHAFNRLDLHLPSLEAKDAVLRMLASPTMLGDQAVTRVEDLDGYKWHLENGATVLFRPSGTEPLLRVYAEAQDQQTVERILSEARALIGF